jgi:hypothetical protein
MYVTSSTAGRRDDLGDLFRVLEACQRGCLSPGVESQISPDSPFHLMACGVRGSIRHFLLSHAFIPATLFSAFAAKE